MFRHRIKDLMIVNAVLAIALGLPIALGITMYQFGLLTGTFLLAVVVPIIWVETYLYRKKHGVWYRLRNPRKPRPQYVPLTDLPPYQPRGLVEAKPILEGRNRTRLFETGPTEPVSRASLLSNVASQLETSGRIDAAVEIYRQILEHYGSTAACGTPKTAYKRSRKKKTSVDMQ